MMSVFTRTAVPTSLMIAICLFANADLARAAQAEPGIEVPVKSRWTFAVSGQTSFTLGPARESPLASDPTGDGEITISLVPPGGAVGVVKLHVFERTAVAIGFTATAFKGSDAIATEQVSGCVGIDSWVTFPAETTSIRAFAFVPVEDHCK